MADKKALFAGRTGDKSAKPSSRSPKKSPSKAAAAGTGEKKRPLSFGKSGVGKGVAATLQRREIQVKEAEDYLKQANKMLTKTITRWNPDFFSAAPLFEKAGACYRAAGEDSKATAMYMQAGECQCHDSVMAHASAAKDFREAALITERQGRKDEAAALYLRCAEAWVHGDEPGRAADYFGRSAKLVKETDEDAAAERYIFASKVMVPKGSDSRSNFTRVVGGVDILVQAITFLASTNRLEQSMEVVCRYIIILQAEGIEHSLGRMYLTYCILALAMGDYVRADAAFRDEHLQSTVYLRSEECRVEEELLTAFKDYRPDLLMKAQNDRTLHRLETAIVRLAKSLRVPGDEDEGDPIPARETPSGSIGDAQARAQALKEKYGGFASAAESSTKASSPPFSGEGGGGGGGGGGAAGTVPPVPPPRPTATNQPPSSIYSPPNPKTTSEDSSPMKSANPREVAEGAPSPPPRPTSDDPARDALFGGGGGGSRKAKAALPPSPPATLAAAETEPSAAIFRESSTDAPGEAEVDLGLGDLEASLEMGSAGVGDDNDDDLEAMIEAARKEAEALALGGDGAAEESEEDIDLT